VSAIRHLSPDFFSVTYGAGGTTRELTTAVADQLQKRFAVPTMHHLTCIRHSRAEVKAVIEKAKERNICNILALHGDVPKGMNHWQPVADEMEYSYQLCELIRSYDDFFSIGVGGFPHRENDSEYLKIKIEAGAEFAITQLFFDTRDYFEYVARVRKAGVTVRIIPGILPISDYQTLLKLCSTIEVAIPQSIHNIFQSLDGEASYQAGVQFMVNHCNELLKGGAPGLHFFTLNKIGPTRDIFNKIKH
jgi:methylenetetrahydrofolate reductase (NADPH)